MKRDSTPWITIQEHPFGFVCTRCGSKDVPQLPLPINEVVKRTREFVRIHSQCKGKATSAQDG